MDTLLLIAQQTDSGAGAAFAVGGGLFLVVLLIGLITSVFWIWMLIDCLVRPMPGVEKLIWVLVILFGHVLGALIYFLVGRSERRVAMG